jgi:hypothetical protein
MLVNKYRLEIQVKKVRKVRNINNIPMEGSRPLECRAAQNKLYSIFKEYYLYVQTIRGRLMYYFKLGQISRSE